MHKTQSLSKPGKWSVPKGGHEIITVLLPHIGNGWRATGKSAVYILFDFSRPEGSSGVSAHEWLLLWISRYVLKPNTAAPRAAPEVAEHRCWKLSYTWRDGVPYQVHDYPLLSVSALPLQNLKIIPSSGALSPWKSESALMGICFNFFLPPLQE